MSERIILSELNPVQKQVLAQAGRRADECRKELDKAVGVYKELLAMAMPTGANGFDDMTGVFYYEEPVPPAEFAEEETGPELVEDEPEQDETEE
ncbi:MAG: hypothetical protein ACYTFQ_19105 [Planctomycetota bacterium]|jgi:hypothetical protein